MSNYAILINPVSGTFSEEGIRRSITEILTDEGHRFTILETDPVNGAKKAAEAALRLNPDGIIICGGDGTMFEVINVTKGSPIPVLLVPCGTGNDFFKMLQLPKDPIDALKVQLHCNPKKVDIGRMNELYFLNVAGTGFDVDVLRAAEKYKKKYKGIKPYFFGLVEAIRHYAPVKCRLRMDSGEYMETRNAIISIGNGRFIGGGMKAVPEAIIDDGSFDLVLVSPVARILVLPLVVFFILGLHLRIGLAKMYRCKKVEIEHENMVVNLDGELFDTDRAEFELIPGGITLRIP